MHTTRKRLFHGVLISVHGSVGGGSGYNIYKGRNVSMYNFTFYPKNNTGLFSLYVLVLSVSHPVNNLYKLYKFSRGFLLKFENIFMGYLCLCSAAILGCYPFLE